MNNLTLDEIAEHALRGAFDQLGMTRDDPTPLPVSDPVERVKKETLDIGCCSEQASTPDASIALNVPQRQMAALTLASSTRSNEEETETNSDDALEVLLSPTRKRLAAASSEEATVRRAVGKLDGATYSLSVLDGHGCSMRVAGPAVACGRHAVIELDGTDRTGLRFDKFGFEVEPPNNVTGLIWDALVDRRVSSLQLKFPRSRDAHPLGSRVSVWEQWTDLLEDAERGSAKFVEQMNRIAIASSDLFAFSQWCEVIRTEILEKWLFHEGGFSQAAARSGFGNLLGPVLAVVLRRKLLSLRTVNDHADVSDFWHRTCSLLLGGNNASANNKRIVEILSDNRTNDLAPTTIFLDKIAEDEERFASELDKLTQQLSSISDSRFSWVVSVLLEISAQRRRQSIDKPAARIVTVWVPGVLSEKAAAILRPGMLLDFDFCLNRRGGRAIGDEFSKEFCNVLETRDRLLQGVRLTPRENLLRSRLGKGSLDGRSGSLAVETALKLVNLNKNAGKTHGIAPFVVLSAEKRDAHVEAVSGLEQKVAVLSEEGVRVLVVADTQRQMASEIAPSCMVVASPSTLLPENSDPSHIEEQIARSLLENDLTGTVSDPRSGIKPAWFMATAAALLLAFLGWRSSLPDNSWRTEALVHHQRVGTQAHTDLWQQVQAISQSHGGETAFVPLMKELSILSQQDRVGVDPRFLASLIKDAHPTVANPGTPVDYLARTSVIIPDKNDDFARAVSLLSSDDFEHRSEREAILVALAESLNVEREMLEIRLLPVNDLTSQGTRKVLYDGKVFDHVASDGQSLWKSLVAPTDIHELDLVSIDARYQLEHLIKTRPIEATFFSRFLRFQSQEKSSNSHVTIELNTSGLGVIPVLGADDKVEVYVKSMPQSQWRPLRSIQGLEETGLTITTVLYRLLPVSRHEQTYTHVQAVYVNAFQDQSVRSLAANADDNPDNDILSDWWGARFEQGTVRGNLAVAFPTNSETGPQGDQEIEPEFGFRARDSESARYEPVKKRLFHDGPRTWIVPEECDLGHIWSDNPNAPAAVVRFRARWSALVSK